MPLSRLHVTGAAGAGVTTLGTALAAALGVAHLDTDDFLWLPSDPPYRHKRAPEQCWRLLAEALARRDDRGWVLAGSLDSWGDALVPRFDHVLFVDTPTPVRLARLRERERRRFGRAALAPGGAMHDQHRAFLAWAAGYDDAAQAGRSRARHEAWLHHLPCPVLRLDGTRTTAAMVARAIEAIT